jgi:hypothetical protein
MQDRSLIMIGSLMVADERIRTKFSGLVGAHGSEEEATFLATKRVDEARHMQFYGLDRTDARERGAAADVGPTGRRGVLSSLTPPG